MIAARLSVVSLACVMAAGVFACGDDTAPTAPVVGNASIRGSVTSEKASTGIAGLVVALLRDGTVVRAAPTDSTGAFAFQGIAPGSYTVRLTGFELANVNLRYTAFTPTEATVTASDEPTDVLFAAVGLVAPHIVGVVSCAGSPVGGARVRVIGGDTDETVSTNAQGRYGATDLAPGHYAVFVVDAPCATGPPYGVVMLKPGQAAEVDFQG